MLKKKYMKLNYIIILYIKSMKDKIPSMKHGGKVIGSGGFGCVFKPSLTCKNKISSPNTISKLMLTKDAQHELEEIQMYTNILKTIPNYKKFFLIDNIEVCHPEFISEKDTEKFDKDCKALLKNGITKQNIHDKLDDLLAINMPYGGISVGTYVDKHPSSLSLTSLHTTLIDLLQNGIIPMNKKDLYHCDIKSSNVLVKKDDSGKIMTRLIDWGLSVHYTNKKQVPDNLYRRPFQFNVPFSVILFSNEFTDSYGFFLKTNTSPKIFQVREYTINFIYRWIKIRGLGHLKTINKKIQQLYDHEMNVEDKKNILTYDFTYYHIIEYISTIIYTFTINGTFHIEDYFNKVFIKNIDIWGFVCIYYPIIDLLYSNYNTLTETDLELFVNLKYLMIHYLFENSVQPIPTQELITFLKNITILFSKSSISKMGQQ